MSKGLPYLPNAPKLDPTLEIYGPAVKGLPKVPNPDALFLDRSNRFQKSWFNNYNKLNKHTQMKIKRVLLKKLRKKNTNWKMKGVNSFLNNSRKRAEVVESFQKELNALPKPPTHLNSSALSKSATSTSILDPSATPATPAGPVASSYSSGVNLNQMRNSEAEKEGMERQRNSDINQLQEAFMTLTLPTNNKTNNFNKSITHDQLEVLFKKLNKGESLTSNNRSYIQEVIKSSKHKGGFLNRFKNKLTGRGGGLTKIKSTTPKRKLNTHKRKSIVNKKKLNTRKRKYITNKKKLDTRKRKSNTHKRK